MAEGAKLELTFPGLPENARDQILQLEMSKLLREGKKKIYIYNLGIQTYCLIFPIRVWPHYVVAFI